MRSRIRLTAFVAIVGWGGAAAFAAPPAQKAKTNAPTVRAVAAKAGATKKPILAEPLAAGSNRAPGLKIVHRFETIMPVGVAITSDGRQFVSYPRWTDKGNWTLAEIKNGKEVPYPEAGAYQQGNKTDPAKNIVSLQGLAVDGKDRLWVLDTGTVAMKPVKPFSPKLIGIDTKTNKVVKTIIFPPTVAPESTYLNDLRIDLRRGEGDGMAFISDSGATSPSGIICVDLKTGKAWRRLAGQPSTQPEPDFVGNPETGPLYKRPKPGVKEPAKLATDGIAISPDGEYLYYTPLSSRKLYRIKVAPLVDQGVTDEAVNRMVEDLGQKGVTDGMEEDTNGNIYFTDWEKRAITKRTPDGAITTVIQDDRLLWPDTLDLANDGYMYLITDQLHREPNYHEGKELRKPPYLLVRFKVDGAKPVVLDDAMMKKAIAEQAKKQ